MCDYIASHPDREKAPRSDGKVTPNTTTQVLHFDELGKSGG